MSKKISGERKAIYYVGLVLMIIGVITFLSTFLVFFDVSPGFKREFHSFNGFNEPMNTFKGFTVRGFGGFIMIALGAVLMNVGRVGLAGSGIILDPEKAREEMEPWNRAAGGMVNDVLEEVDAVKDITKAFSSNMKSEDKVLVKIRCRACGELNDEDAKYCKGCGQSL